jgi:hypothetical protein
LCEPTVTRTAATQDQIRDRLKEAIELLRKDATRVEIWAAALGSFSQPVPTYEPDDRFRLPPQRSTVANGVKNRRG